MTRPLYHRLLVVGAVGLLAGVTASAATFSVRRGHSAAQVRGNAPKALVVTSPFDDDGGSLKDGELHYYTVSSDSDGPTTVSVHKNLASNSVRVAFDDGLAFGAAADARLSTVYAKPATAVADGVSTITLQIVPRDAGGTPLGQGLSIALDSATLWPASVVGSIVDNSNGSYSVRIASALPGSGNVAVSVDGTWLDSEPAFEFTDPGSGSLRDQALDRFDDLGGGSGSLQELTNRLSGSAVSAELKSAAMDLDKAQDDLGKGMDAKALNPRLADSLGHIGDARDQLSGQDRDDLELLMDRLAASGRLIAVHHIAQVEAVCGVCSAGSPDSVCQARARLDKGDGELARQPPDHVEAVRRFAEAIDSASAGCR